MTFGEPVFPLVVGSLFAACGVMLAWGSAEAARLREWRLSLLLLFWTAVCWLAAGIMYLQPEW
jgi:hypothetical protein